MEMRELLGGKEEYLTERRHRFANQLLFCYKKGNKKIELVTRPGEYLLPLFDGELRPKL